MNSHRFFYVADLSHSDISKYKFTPYKFYECLYGNILFDDAQQQVNLSDNVLKQHFVEMDKEAYENMKKQENIINNRLKPIDYFCEIIPVKIVGDKIIYQCLTHSSISCPIKINHKSLERFGVFLFGEKALGNSPSEAFEKSMSKIKNKYFEENF